MPSSCSTAAISPNMGRTWSCSVAPDFTPSCIAHNSFKNKNRSMPCGRPRSTHRGAMKPTKIPKYNPALAACCAVLVAAACASAGQSTANPSPVASDGANPAPTTDPRIKVAAGFESNTIASVDGARELAALPNGDLLVGTNTYSLDIVPDAEGAGAAGATHVFVTLPDHWAQSV